MQFAATPNFYPGPTIPPQCLAAGPREGRSFPTLVTCKSTWLSDPSKNSKTSFGLFLVASILPPSRFCPLYHSCCLPTPAASRVPAVPYTAFKGTEPPKQWSRDAPIRPILRWPERWASAPPFATSLLLISSWPQKPPQNTKVWHSNPRTPSLSKGLLQSKCFTSRAEKHPFKCLEILETPL